MVMHAKLPIFGLGKATTFILAFRRVNAKGLGFGHPAFELWLALVVSAEVRGKHAHDAHFAAVMLSRDVTHILTLKTADFDGLPGITVSFLPPSWPPKTRTVV